MGLSDNPICRQCVTEEETSVHVLCACEELASLRHSYLCPFFLDPEDIRKLHTGAIWKFVKGTGKGKGKAIPLQAWTGPEGSRRLRLPHFKTIGTRRW